MGKILVIGGSGFVGTNFINICNKSSLVNFDKNQSLLHKDITVIGNILQKNSIDKVMSNIDSVLLLAAEHKDNVSPTSLYYDVNVEGTKNVLKSMDKYGVKNLIFTSSVAVYGLNKISPNENSSLDPFNHYGKSKLMAEQLIKNWFKKNKKNKSVTVIRPTVIFGKKNRGNVYNLLKQIFLKRFVMLGSGNNKKSMAYVENITLFIKQRLSVLPPGYHLYNYVDKPDLTMNELVHEIELISGFNIPKFKINYNIALFIGYLFDIVSYLFGKNFNISSVRIKKFCSTTQFSSGKLEKIYKPRYSLAEGLKITILEEFVKKSNQ